MRVRVSIDTYKPLCRCVVLSRPDAQASMCPLQYERFPLFCLGCGLIGHPVLACLTTPKVEGQKFQYGAWLRAPLPKRSAARPHGRLSLVDDDQDVPVSTEPVDSALDPYARANGATAPASSSDPPVPNETAPMVRTNPKVPNLAAPAVRADYEAPEVAAPAVRKGPTVPKDAAPVVRTPPPTADTPPNLSVPLEKDVMVEDELDEDSPSQDAPDLAVDGSFPDDAPYDPMVHTETSDMLEEALERSRDCVLLADLTGVIQADGEDLVNEAIPEAADSIIREVEASILGVDAPPDAPVTPSRKGPSLSASPSMPGLSKSAPAGLRRTAMPVVPEHQEFDEWASVRPRRFDLWPVMLPIILLILFYLCEMCLRTQNSTFLRTVLGFENCFFVDVGPGCTGLAIFWNNNIKVDLLSYSALHIDVVITYDSSISFRFTGMHGRSESSLKKHNRALIDRLRVASPLPWLLGGDFNEILTLSEKQGGHRKPHHQLTYFPECLLRNNLANCKPSQGWFTWMKSGPRTAPTRERLDRFIADNDWFLNFPTFRAWSEYSPNFDHHFILLDTVAPSPAPGPVARILYFVSTTVGPRATDLERIPRLRSEINRLSSRRLSPKDLEVLLAAKGPLASARDQNTSFFHAKASARRKKNALMGLYDDNGYWQNSTNEVLRIASDYFVSLFSANPPIVDPSFLEHIAPSVTEDMNSGLLATFTAEEVIAAFRDINPRKSPGIDGLPSGFFR
ncbi:hypothetical protein GQ457_16G018250 [Hibiscus cannabinus]